jgi:hypothetical protein
VVPDPAPLARMEPAPHGMLAYRVDFTATFRETSGVDATVESFILTAVDTTTGQVVGQAIPPNGARLPLPLAAGGTTSYADSWFLQILGFAGAPEAPVPGPLVFHISSGFKDAYGHSLETTLEIPEEQPRVLALPEPFAR